MSSITSNANPNFISSVLEDGIKKSSEKLITSAISTISDLIMKKYTQTLISLESVFTRYLNNSTFRFNHVRTLATGPDPRNILGENSLYVPLYIRHRYNLIDTSTVYPLLNLKQNVIILGTGGIGKSMLMRYFFLQTAKTGEHIPVLVDLHRISNEDPSNLSILEFIYSCLIEFDIELPKEFFEYSLRSGKYLFLFDGFDEIKESSALAAADAIQKFVTKYPQNPCIITSRQSQHLAPLETFIHVELREMDKQQAIEMAKKIWTEDEKTREFCNQLETSLFDKHRDFAENPLLLSMMFLTFMRNNSIPDHLDEFYQKAYDALYSMHDNTSKGIYKRDFFCKVLDEKQFKHLFSHFCFHSYFNEKYEFTEDEILTYINKGISKLELNNVNALAYLKDLVKNVCMLIIDGHYYRFSHRSFQAYFAAYYTTHLTDEQQKRLFEEQLLKRKVYMENYDFYNILCQIEPKRFSINALEKPARSIINAAYETSSPEEYVMRQIMSGIVLVKDHHDNTFFREHIDLELTNPIYFNAFSLLLYKILKYTPTHQYSRRYESLLNYCQHLYSRIDVCNMPLNFYAIDQTNRFAPHERDIIYSLMISELEIIKKIDLVQSWLSTLDVNNNNLKCTNFIDSL